MKVIKMDSFYPRKREAGSSEWVQLRLKAVRGKTSLLGEVEKSSRHKESPILPDRPSLFPCRSQSHKNGFFLSKKKDCALEVYGPNRARLKRSHGKASLLDVGGKRKRWGGPQEEVSFLPAVSPSKLIKMDSFCVRKVK